MRVLAACLLVSLSISAAHAQLRYRVTSLNPSDNAIPGGMSPNGQVCGQALEGSRYYAFRIESDIADLTSHRPESSGASGVNDSGVVIGGLYTNSHLQIPFVADPAAGLQIISPFGGLYATLYGISSDGTIVGHASLPGNDEAIVPFQWRNGVTTPLALPPNGVDAVPLAISPNGSFIAGIVTINGTTHGVLWSNGAATILPSPAGARYAVANVVNNSGTVAGLFQGSDFNAAACTWASGNVTVLPGLDCMTPSYVISGINSQGQIVGTLACAGILGLTWINGQLIDLNTVVADRNVIIETAAGIDEAGRILSWGRLPGSPNQILLLTPVCPADFNADGDTGADADIESFFACLAGNCCRTCPSTADFNNDGDIGTDQDIEAFFTALGSTC